MKLPEKSQKYKPEQQDQLSVCQK